MPLATPNSAAQLPGRTINPQLEPENGRTFHRISIGSLASCHPGNRPFAGLKLYISPGRVYRLLTKAVTMGGVVAGTVLSTLWFVRVLRRNGLRVRFTPECAIGVW
jgi:hypothetical protein